MTDSANDYLPIAAYGVIGDCHTAALVSSRGSIDWLCLPHFDSPSIFARILDARRGGCWSVQPVAPFQAEHRYLDETNVLETVFRCDQGQVRLLDFMPVDTAFGAGTTQSSRIIFRIVEGIAGAVEIESRCAPRPDYAGRLPSFQADGDRVRFDGFQLSGLVRWTIDDQAGDASCRVVARAGERVAFALRQLDAGAAADTGASLLEPLDSLRRTIDFWRRWAGQCSYQGPYRDAVIRSALALKLCIYTPSGAIVAAPTTSLPEQIGGERNWDYRFTWIRDASFTLYALLLAGFDDEDAAFFDWINRTVRLERAGIKVLFPITPDGSTVEQELDHLEGYRGSRPVRVGNAAVHQLQLDIYGEVFDALYFACRAGGFNPVLAWEHFRPLADWVATNWRLPGSGIWEVRGGKRHFVYGKVMTWAALDRAIKLATEYGLAGDLHHWRRQRDAIRADVFARGWSDRLGAFKQSYEDDRLDAANLRLPIVGFIDGDDPRMVATIDATLEQLVVEGLCYRYLDAPEGLSGHEATFVLCNFWLVSALMLAGREQEAQDLYEQTLARASPLGLFAEEIDPATGAHLGNFPQAFSHIGVISGAVSLAHTGKEGSVKPEKAEAARRAAIGGGGQGQKSYTRSRQP